MTEIWAAAVPTIITLGAAMGAGFMLFWREMNRRFSEVNTRLDRIEGRLDHSFDVLREQGERLARLGPTR